MKKVVHLCVLMPVVIITPQAFADVPETSRAIEKLEPNTVAAFLQEQPAATQEEMLWELVAPLVEGATLVDADELLLAEDEWSWDVTRVLIREDGSIRLSAEIYIGGENEPTYTFRGLIDQCGVNRVHVGILWDRLEGEELIKSGKIVYSVSGGGDRDGVATGKGTDLGATMEFALQKMPDCVCEDDTYTCPDDNACYNSDHCNGTSKYFCEWEGESALASPFSVMWIGA